MSGEAVTGGVSREHRRHGSSLGGPGATAEAEEGDARR